MTKKDFIKINDYLWEIPKSFRSDMRVPARVYADQNSLDDIFRDRSLEQLVNLTTLPGIQKYSLAMPDCHEGYGSPIGGVAAIDTQTGVISPGVCGYDINCGMKLLRSEVSVSEIRPYLEKLADGIYREVPSGLGRGRQTKVDLASLDKILEGGARRLVEQGCGEKEDIENCEAGGRLDWADTSAVSAQAKNRGRNQVGTLGSGNHFLEIQRVSEIFDENAAKSFGLFQNQIVIMIHTGSRGLGHQIATDYLRLMVNTMSKYKISLPDRELVAVPFKSPEGQKYFQAMACGANFAWANRQMINHSVRKVWKELMGDKKLTALYDVTHNIIKLEKYKINGKQTEVLIHRKGATRAFPPGHSEIPERYREVGQPVLIPGSMGTASYILAGTNAAEESFYSTCHGAGRTMSRHEAMRRVTGKQVLSELESKG
ncbi:MAG: RtcB family protein, partial [bacterium]|nr:RtcB family protein [bacterium]